MNDRLKSELEKTTYSKSNLNVFFVIVIAVVAISFFFFIVPPFEDETPKTSSQTPPTPTYMKVGVWSQTYRIRPGCTIRYDGGNGSRYKVRYRYGNESWKIHPGRGAVPVADQVQFMALKQNVSSKPFTITCNK